MKKNVDIVSRGVGVYLTLSGCIAASLTFPCHITKDTFWDEGDTVNCSYRHLTQVPRDIPAGTTTLLLNNNDISQLGPTDFSNLTELRHLDLSTNVLQSNQIATDAFVALGSLLYLDLSYNSLCMSNECFPKSLYGPLRLLKVFKATRKYAIADPRGIVEYPFRSLSVLEVLRELHVSGIPNVAIPSDIALLKKLQVLDLYLGRLSNISAATFRALHGSNIMTLSLRDNGISQVELGTFSNLPNLRNLNIACNRHIGFKALIKVLWCTTNSGIDSVIMDSVERGGEANILNFNGVCDTPFAKKLRRLSVRQNNIIAVDGNYFGKCLPNVQRLNLGFNNINFLKTHGLKRTDAVRIFPPLLLGIDISYYGSLPGEFRRCYCRRRDVSFDDAFRIPTSVAINNITIEEHRNTTLKRHEGAFYLMPSIRYFFGDHMSLSSRGYGIKALWFYPDSNLVYFNMSNTKAIKSLDGPWDGMRKLQTFDLSHGILQHIAVDFFMYFDNLRFLNLSDNKLGDLPPRQNKTQTTAVYGRVFNHIAPLEELDLSQNSFQTIYQTAFENLTKLRVLKLSDNLLKRQFSLNLSRLRSLQWLNLSGNEMSALSEDLRHSLDELSERVNFSLDISGNPLSCTSCASLPFLRWLRATRVRIVAKDMLTCAENHNLRVVSISLEDLEASCASAAPGPSLLSVAGSVGFCTLSMVFFLYVNRWRMRWYYYSIKRHLRQKDGSTQDTNHYRYDACVVYADADLNWVAHELIEQVETDWALSLFVYDRDSQAGFPIAENIVQSLETSRYVLFVVTPDFCDDKWCDFALNMALLRDHKSLVMLYIKPIVHDCASRTLRALMNPRTRCTLVEWGDGEYAQSLFWQRLHDTLLPTSDSDMLLYRLAPCTHRPLLLSE